MAFSRIFGTGRNPNVINLDFWVLFKKARIYSPDDFESSGELLKLRLPF
jgi:hypothetical protein